MKPSEVTPHFMLEAEIVVKPLVFGDKHRLQTTLRLVVLAQRHPNLCNRSHGDTGTVNTIKKGEACEWAQAVWYEDAGPTPSVVNGQEETVIEHLPAYHHLRRQR